MCASHCVWKAPLSCSTSAHCAFLFSECLRARAVWCAKLNNCSSVASVTLEIMLRVLFLSSFFLVILRWTNKKELQLQNLPAPNPFLALYLCVGSDYKNQLEYKKDEKITPACFTASSILHCCSVSINRTFCLCALGVSSEMLKKNLARSTNRLPAPENVLNFPTDVKTQTRSSVLR